MISLVTSVHFNDIFVISFLKNIFLMQNLQSGTLGCFHFILLSTLFSIIYVIGRVLLSDMLIQVDIYYL